MTIGKRIARWRNSRGLTQRELAVLVGVSPAAIGQFETSKAKPTLDTLEALTRALRVSMAKFWGRCPAGPS